jgi:hypothetical protein
MKYDDEYTERSWVLFKVGVAMELLNRNLAENIHEALKFAESLDMSFEQDYHPTSITEWPALIARDADEFEKDVKK